MAQRTCAVCTLDHYARGYCKSHYRRVLEGKGLQPDKPLRKLPKASERDDIVARILAETVVRDSGCIEWVTPGQLNEHGYGTISWRGKRWLSHRAMWTSKVGPIPAGLTIDHLCRNRACQNVEHMEVVTQVENALRGGGLDIAVEVRRRRAEEQCARGHDRGEHGHRLPSGSWYCRPCRADSHVRSKQAAESRK